MDKKEPNDITASGVVISGKRILTNAHVVQYASEVQVRPIRPATNFQPLSKLSGPGSISLCSNWKTRNFSIRTRRCRFESRSRTPRTRSWFTAIPPAGPSLSITKGIISRIEFTGYSLSALGLRIQIDAAINPGNSGGPAVVNDEIVGLAFSHLQTAQNIGYIIPVEEIELFLQDVADGSYDGKPVMYDDLQTLENPALRSYLHLPESLQGMVVHRPFDPSPNYPLKEWDVITKIARRAGR